MAAEMIVVNAKVLTMDLNKPRAEAVALGGGKVLAVGSRAEVEALAGPGCRVIDAGGRTVMPGFVESHLHLVLGGSELVQLQLGGVHGFEALKAAFLGYAAQNAQRALLMAQGAAYEILDHPVTRHDLDRIIADRPIAMMSPAHHTVWANTAALTAAGLLHGAEMPPGHFVVMGADGTATGELREFEAFGPVLALGGEAHLQLGIATGGDHHVLLATGPVGDRQCHARHGQIGAPQFFARGGFERAQLRIHRCGDEGQPAAGRDRTPDVRRTESDAFGQRDARAAYLAERHVPAYFAGGQIDRGERAPGRRRAGNAERRLEQLAFDAIRRADQRPGQIIDARRLVFAGEIFFRDDFEDGGEILGFDDQKIAGGVVRGTTPVAAAERRREEDRTAY